MSIDSVGITHERFIKIRKSIGELNSSGPDAAGIVHREALAVLHRLHLLVDAR